MTHRAWLLAAILSPVFSVPSVQLDTESRREGQQAPGAGGVPLRERSIASEPYFEENRGQLERSDVRFFTRGPERQVGFAPGRVVFNALRWKSRGGEWFEHAGGVVINVDVGHGAVAPEPLEPLPGKSNYFRGQDPGRWITGVRHYRRILYRDVYPQVDLAYFFDERGRLTYEFFVKPGGDPGALELAYSGIERLEADGPRVMEAVTPVGRLRDGELLCYQETGDERTAIASRFDRRGESSYGIELLEPYDPTRTLVVDPTVSFSTYWGDGGGTARTVAIDPNGNIYITGGTSNTTWPVTSGAYDTTPPTGTRPNGTLWPDVTVAKFDTNGTLVYSTYIGGTGEDYAYVSAVNAAGEVFCSGRAGPGFPTTAGAFDTTFNGGPPNGSIHGPVDAFVVRLSANGDQLIYSTYIGGDGDENGRAIHLLPTNEVLVGNRTDSSNFPTTPGVVKTSRSGSVDAWVAKVAADGSRLVFCTLFGASNDTGGGEAEMCRSLGVDAAGNVWMGGHTKGTDLTPTLGAIQATRGSGVDLYFAKLSPDATQLLYFTWFGGNDYEEIETEGVVDAAGNFYVVGSTKSPDFPTSPGAFQSSLQTWDGFAIKINSNGTLGFSTLYGGSLSTGGYAEAMFGPAVDSLGNVYCTGRFGSSDCPVTSTAFQPQHAPDGNKKDVVFVVFSPDGRNLLYGTYLGGTDFEQGRYIALSPDESFVVLTGEVGSTDFPMVNARQTNPAGAFITKFDVTDLSSSSGTPGTFQFSASGVAVAENAGSATLAVTRTGGSTGAVSVSYATGNGTAAAGSDYIGASGTFSWGSGDTSPRSITVTVLDDAVQEPDETVLVSLQGPTGGASLGSPSTAVLTIANDDTSSDSDGDGLPDSWELTYWPNLNQGAAGDPDSDALSNLDEYTAGTDPTNPDTDGDGLTDGDEVHVYGTNPTAADTDGDGMTDDFEITHGFDPLDPDQDNNGILDGQDDWDGDLTINQLDPTPGSPPGGSPSGGGGGSGGSGGCGATGLELLLALGAVGLIRRKKKA